MANSGKTLHRSQFLKEVKEVFPQIRASINHQYGLFHLEVHVFTDLTQSFIDDCDKNSFIKAIQIVDRFFKDGNSQIVTALTVSFLEHLNFKDDIKSRSWAWGLMPTQLKARYNDISDAR